MAPILRHLSARSTPTQESWLLRILGLMIIRQELPSSENLRILSCHVASSTWESDGIPPGLWLIPRVELDGGLANSGISVFL